MVAPVIPEKPVIPEDAQLTRKQFAEALTAHGFPIRSATLATMATRGGGPPYQTFGRTCLVTWGIGLAWAKSRLSKPRTSTSERAA